MKPSICLICAALVMGFTSVATRAQLPEVPNGDFETGDLTGWVPSAPVWSARDVSANYGFVPEGSFALASDAGSWDPATTGTIRSENPLTLPGQPCALCYSTASSGGLSEGFFVRMHDSEEVIIAAGTPYFTQDENWREVVFPILDHPSAEVHLFGSDLNLIGNSEFLADIFRFEYISRMIDRLDGTEFDTQIWDTVDGFELTTEPGTSYPANAPQVGDACARTPDDSYGQLRTHPITIEEGETRLFFMWAHASASVNVFHARLLNADDEEVIAEASPLGAYAVWFSYAFPVDDLVGQSVILEFESGDGWMAVDAIGVLGGPPPNNADHWLIY